MSIRIRLSRFFIGLGAFIQSLPLVVMKPDDMIEFTRQGYTRPGNVEGWSEDIIINSGLNQHELDLIKFLPTTNGDLLILGVGGGREAIFFAQMGFQVTGIDFIPGMVENAIRNAENRGTRINGLVQEISTLDMPEDAFDVVWISSCMYSCIPSSSRRVSMLKRLICTLKPGGTLICLFACTSNRQNKGRAERLRRIIASSPIGNRHYENGDTLWLNLEFSHVFTTKEEIFSELQESGLHVTQINMNTSSSTGSAVCIKHT